jgi:Na+/melibiose symporter-like transporter
LDGKESNTLGSWRPVLIAYATVLISFAFIRLILVSQARDPFIWGVEVPVTQTFRLTCGFASAAFGIFALFIVGRTMDRGTPQQMMAFAPLLPLILVLMELVSMEF